MRDDLYDTRGWKDPADPLPLDRWPTRVRNALRNDGITTWGDLLELTHAQLWRIPGIGPLGMRQLVTFIEENRSRRQST